MTESNHPPFIATQKLLRLQLTDTQRASTRDYLLGKNVHSTEPLENQASDRVTESLWRPVPISRRDILSRRGLDERGRGERVCVTVDGGFGKSIALQQVQYLHQTSEGADGLRETNLAIRLRLAELPLTWEGMLDKKWWSPIGKKLSEKLPAVLTEQIRCILKAAGKAGKSSLGGLRRRDIRSWLTALIGRGRFTLLVDALDEVAVKDGRKRIAALKEFLRQYPSISIYVGTRKYALEDYWTLFSDGTTGGSAWEFLSLAAFERDEREKFVGADRNAILESVGANELFVPRTLEIVRTLDDEVVTSIRSAADVYWHSIDKTFGLDFEKHRKAGKIKLERDEIIDLFGALAFCCLTWKKSGPVRQVSRNEFSRFRDDFCKIAAKGFSTWSEKKKRKLPKLLNRLAEINSQFIQFAFLGSRNIKDLNWRNTTVRDFLAALWVSRRSGKAERKRLRTRVVVRHAGFGTVFEKSSRNLEYYDFWRFLTEMPLAAFASSSADVGSDDEQIHAYVQSVWMLFERRPAESRPAEMIYRCWPNLLRLSGHQIASEQQIDEITSALQAEVWDTVKQNKEFKFSNSADKLLKDWLAEYPRILFSQEESGHDIARHFESTFRPIPDNADDSLEFWCGADDAIREIPASFSMSAEQVTNELIRLYDVSHGNLNGDYSGNSPYDRGAAIYVRWFDAWCLSRWLHGRLPTDHEWEFACRAAPGNTEHRSDWHFVGEESKSQLGEYAWYDENSAEIEDLFSGERPEGVHAHSVGRKRANDFGLYDMHGNVWEWCSSVYPGESGQNASRILRGGSFLSLADFTRCSVRGSYVPPSASRVDGVRVARATFTSFP